MSDLMGRLMGDPPYRADAYADVAEERAAAAAWIPESAGQVDVGPRGGRPRGRQTRNQDELRAQAREMWQRGSSIGMIASVLNLPLSKAYDYAKPQEGERHP